MQYPILYSLHRCPYAMRARTAIILAQQTVLLRDIVMTNKPVEMLSASVKATVPVLIFDDQSVIDESLDIMTWALGKNDPDNLLYSDQPEALSEMLYLISRNDNEFVNNLKKYKVTARYHDIDEKFYRQKCELFIAELEQRLTEHAYIMGEKPSLADIAILPFIRQFSRTNRQWYLQAPYPNLRRWLKTHIQSSLFSKIMTKYPQWLDHPEDMLFPAK
ncbi:Glutathione S-transferase, C-terminal domain protein [Psychromonas ingrahamii 37]|uniref:Glutathione S-transferase, C-terminal domain protein n=1 Tax=Psychromonas ingrahamii (strain DSM 17664 / CCUG 51855 / 37) TaxID=357804 RepID=A1SVL1_PSYIN|nr:glutathione S-transferase [Psychromonas ingrahamii]ABM03526.1 Glutathione S-transferase, C-terminal domain protein [Psychromonas ingrahamii 37]